MGTKESELNGDMYRIMVTNHEIGHLLSRHHLKWEQSKQKCGVMHQQTRKPSKLSCRPNIWPILEDYNTD